MHEKQHNKITHFEAKEREPGCMFCEELLTQKDGLIAESRSWRMLVSYEQGYLGRTMVIAKRHIPSLREITHEESDELLDLQTRLMTATEEAFGADWWNWEQLGNDAFQTDNVSPHLHYHLRPRYKDSLEFGGYTFTDPNFGHRADYSHRFYIEDAPNGIELKNAIADAIWEHLPSHYGLDR